MLILLLLTIGAFDSALAQKVVEYVRTDTVQPFILEGVEVVVDDPFSDANLLAPLNRFHALTRESVILDEVFVEDGDTVTQIDLDEIERNLRNLDIFSEIRLQLVSLEAFEGEVMPVARLKITTRDSWSLRPGAGYREVENNPRVSVSLREVNLAGFAQQVGVGIEYSPKESEKFRVSGNVFEPNIAGTHLRAGGSFLLSGSETGLSFGVDRPFYSDRAPDAFAAAGAYYDGPQSFYFHGTPNSRIEIPLSKIDGSGWYSLKQAGRRDVFRTSMRLTYNRTDIDSAGPFQRAFDNSVGVFLGLSSVSRRYVHFRDVDFDGVVQVPVGGMGNVSFGKISPHSGGLDNVLYLGAELRQAHLFGKRLYLFGAAAAGTGLSGKQARFTLQRSNAGALFLVQPGVLAMRLSQSTVWNWPRYLLLPLDKENGLRGYEQLQLFGHNRIVANFEYRLFPVVSALGHRLGLTGFYDIGGVWDQGAPFTSTRFHSSAGIGFRLSGGRSNVNSGLYRLDIAWALDPDTRSFIPKLIAGVSIGTSEFMTPFGSLDHVPPGVHTP